MPDVSRVYHRPYNGMHSDSLYRENLFNRARKTNLLPFPALKNIQSVVTRERYYDDIIQAIRNSKEFPNLNMCFSNNTIMYPNTEGYGLRVFYLNFIVFAVGSIKKETSVTK